MLAISLALGSSLAWGVSDFLGGLKSRTLPLLTVLVISQGCALVLLAVVVMSVGNAPPGGSFLLYAALAGVAETLGVARLTAVAAFVAAMIATRQRVAARRADIPGIALIGVLVIAADAMYATASTHGLLSVVAVLSTLYPIVTIALARALLGERVERRQWLGITVCMCGIVAISAA